MGSRDLFDFYSMGVKMGYEIDFLEVGENSKSGDAIALRFGNFDGTREEQKVVIIDGGYKVSGENLVNLVKNHYETDYVDLVVLTHPDADHASGLKVVLDELNVGELWMHKPWEHNIGKASLFKDGRVTDNSIGERLKKSLDTAYSLYELAIEKDIRVQEPFAGLGAFNNNLQVIGPAYEYYNELLLDFTKMPEKAAITSESSFFLNPITTVAKKALSWVTDHWSIDSIVDEGDETSAQNNSSVILQLTVDGKRLLFTGDAGRQALTYAADCLGDRSSLLPLQMMQIPHHGSFRNIGPTVLDQLVGPKVAIGTPPHFAAIVSCAPEGEPKHPSRKVTNAFKRRGADVAKTAGKSVRYFTSDAPKRDGYTAIDTVEFYDLVEE